MLGVIGAGGLAGAIAGGACTPQDVIKTRLQTASSASPVLQRAVATLATRMCSDVLTRACVFTVAHRYNGVLDCATKIIKEEGFAALYKGALNRMAVQVRPTPLLCGSCVQWSWCMTPLLSAPWSRTAAGAAVRDCVACVRGAEGPDPQANERRAVAACAYALHVHAHVHRGVHMWTVRARTRPFGHLVRSRGNTSTLRMCIPYYARARACMPWIRGYAGPTSTYALPAASPSSVAVAYR